MAKRSFIISLLICLIYLSSYSIAISTPSTLVVIPHAEIPERGTLEYGIRSRIYADVDDRLDSDAVAFYHLSLTDKFQLGLNTSQEIDILMSVKALIASDEFEYSKHKLAVGLHNLGLTERYFEDGIWKSITKTSLPRLRSYVVYTVQLPKLRSFYHIGLADYYDFQEDYIIVGAHYDFKLFQTSAEWDGRQVHFRLLFKLPNNMQLQGALTPIPDKLDGVDRHFISLAFTYKSKIFKEKNQEELDAMRDDYNLIKNKLAVLDAKTDVIREFSSLDFLEEFQQFLLQEHMVKDELNSDRKTEIRSALEHMQRGLEFYYQEQYLLSLKEYEIVTTLVPTFSIAYARLGSIHYKLGNLKQARAHWLKALELDPSNDNLKLFLKRITPPENNETPNNSDLPDLPQNLFNDEQLLKIIPENDQT